MQFCESFIGIFWFYQGTLICKKLLISESKEDTLGIHDSPFQHIQEWESKNIYLASHPELLGTEYQELPRGRVVYSSRKKAFTVYGDKACLTKKAKIIIINNFKLPTENTLFKSDPHYQIFKYC
ncbi:hypothetical protein [Shewanella sp. 10N.286.48.B5]|uniref:hypothetical protein n=1 Tax=Shewanella sp. 10N.286.48.B5 TaxID=1880834 RepID=UPI000C8380AC|nr:hypothetical protein [Shewanella sp. 10N.286.48.B5]PMH85896.1 hypothetical protein BCU57_12730 [Shewanella sp. 10N.286.48.B5]